MNVGKLVIVDQSTGDPVMNRRAAERIMWRVFQTQQDKFRNAVVASGMMTTLCQSILVYLEEAHNLLPRAGSAKDVLRTVWARAAKEGSKMNIGMVLATQAPSSIMPEILSETDNWILAYLNSQNERKVIAGYMDFEDFLRADRKGQRARIREDPNVVARLHGSSAVRKVQIGPSGFSTGDEDHAVSG